MKRSLFILMAALLLVSLLAFVAACGDEETTETTRARPPMPLLVLPRPQPLRHPAMSKS